MADDLRLSPEEEEARARATPFGKRVWAAGDRPSQGASLDEQLSAWEAYQGLPAVTADERELVARDNAITGRRLPRLPQRASEEERTALMAGLRDRGAGNDEHSRLVQALSSSRPRRTDIYRQAKALERDEQMPGVGWSDYGKAIMLGFAGLGDLAQRGARYLPGPELYSKGISWLSRQLGVEDLGFAIDNLGSSAVDYWTNSLSDAAKAERSKSFVQRNEHGELEFGEAGLQSALLMGAESLPSTLAGAGVGAGITKVLQVFANPFGRAALMRAAAPLLEGASASTPQQLFRATQAVKKLRLIDSVLGVTGFGAGEGVLSGGQNAISVYDEVMRLPFEKISQNPRYQQVYNTTDGMDEASRHKYAAETVAREAASEAGLQSGLVTALLGAPMGAYFGRLFGRTGTLGSTRLTAAAVGMAGEASQEALQSGAEAFLGGRQVELAGGDVDLLQRVVDQSIGGALAGGPLGGAMAFAESPADAKPAQDRGSPRQTLMRAALDAKRAGVHTDDIVGVINRPGEVLAKVAAIRGLKPREAEQPTQRPLGPDIAAGLDPLRAPRRPPPPPPPAPTPPPGPAAHLDVVSPIDEAAHAASSSPLNNQQAPTPNQDSAENYKVGRVAGADVGLPSLDLAVEYPRGSERNGIVMRNHYGRFTGSTGGDGQAVDFFLGRDSDSDRVYLFHHYANGRFQQHKALIGMSREEADETLRDFYRTPQPNGDIVELSRQEFEQWMARGETRSPHPGAPQRGFLKPPAPETLQPTRGPLTEAKINVLRALAEQAGWLQKGGKMVRGGLDPAKRGESDAVGSEAMQGEVVSRTQWVPKADWWPGRPGGFNEAQTAVIIEKGIKGQKLGSKQQEYFDFLSGLADEAVASQDWMPTGDELAADTHTDPVTDGFDVSLVARATELDENAVEQASRQYENDDAGFLRAVKAIVDAHATPSGDRPASAAPAQSAEQGQALGPAEPLMFARAGTRPGDVVKLPPEAARELERITAKAGADPGLNLLAQAYDGGQSTLKVPTSPEALTAMIAATAGLEGDALVTLRSRLLNARDAAQQAPDFFEREGSGRQDQLFEPTPTLTVSMEEDGRTSYSELPAQRNQLDMFLAAPAAAGRATTAPSSEGAGPATAPAAVKKAKPASSSFAPTMAQGFDKGVRVVSMRTGSFRTAVANANSAENAAHIMAPIRRGAQESLYALVLNDKGKPLAVLRHSIGGTAEAFVFMGPLLGQIHNVPGAAKVWFAHNHPSGYVTQSEADNNLTYRLEKILRGTGIEALGMIVVGPGGRTASVHYASKRASATPHVQFMTKPGARAAKSAKEVPLYGERRVLGDPPPEASTGITSEAEAVKIMQKWAPEEQTGVLLLNTRNKPLGFVEMTDYEMTRLRSGQVGTGASKLLRAIERTNAVMTIVKTKSLEAGQNVGTFMYNINLHPLDILMLDANGELRTTAARGGSVGKTFGAFYSRSGVAEAGPPTREALMAEIPQSVAYNAYTGTSFSPERRAEQQREGYADQMLADYAFLLGKARNAEERATVETEWPTFKDRYRQRLLAYLHSRNGLVSAMIAGPSKFPVARMEKKHRTVDKRLGELVEGRKRALEAIMRKLRPELAPVRTGDADAAATWQKRLDQARELQRIMVEANKVVRAFYKAGVRNSESGELWPRYLEKLAAIRPGYFDEGKATKLLTPDFAGRIGFADYATKNNGAEIRRLEGQVAAANRYQAEAAKAGGVQQFKFDAGDVELDYADNRIRVRIEKSDLENRAKLKAAGFRWSPQNTAWQRQLTDNAKAVTAEITGVDFAAPVQAPEDAVVPEAQAQPAEPQETQPAADIQDFGELELVEQVDVEGQTVEIRQKAQRVFEQARDRVKILERLKACVAS